MKEIDARKLACPTPVLLARQALDSENPETLKVIVDNDASMQNVSRFLKSRSYGISVEAVGADFHVTGARTEAAAPAENPSPAPETRPAAGKIMVMIATDRIGSGDDVLGRKLMVNFINTLNEMGPELWRLVLVNNGVKLAVEGSEVVESLKALESEGIMILVCGTCLDHYDLLDKKAVGETTNMLDIVTSMQLADKTINI